MRRKRDCLHRFMVVLCERGQLQELCEYPYVNLHDEVTTQWFNYPLPSPTQLLAGNSNLAYYGTHILIIARAIGLPTGV